MKTWCDAKDKYMPSDEAFAIDCDAAHNMAVRDAVKFFSAIRDALSIKIAEMTGAYSDVAGVEVCDQFNDLAVEVVQFATEKFNGQPLDDALASFSSVVRETIRQEIVEGA